jgi:hypothetical protein
MRYYDSHLSDQQLLLDVDGELSAREEKRIRAHLAACWKCRTRRRELERAITDFVHVHQRQLDARLPPAAGPRALLKAQLAHVSATQPRPSSSWFAVPPGLGWALAAACGLVVLGLFLVRSVINRQDYSRPSAAIVSLPDSRLTPGAALLESRQAVCAQSSAKNKAVPVALQRSVFQEYGITGAEPRAYEVDYLITPALGGADDIHNLWPHSYSATVWNAEVKDALEDRLRELVCDGNLDLTEAQREIATDWIAAYKKYFHTEEPLVEHNRRSAQ